MRHLTFSVRDARIGGLGLLAAGGVWPLLDEHVSLACPLRTITGIPCPLCGMTTSVVAATHADVDLALAANPGGVVLVASALWLLLTRRSKVQMPTVVPLAALGGTWIFELFRFDVL